jgi:hypothetical protein
LFLFSSSLLSFSQSKKLVEGDWVYDATFGFNFTKLKSADKELERIARPFVGIKGAYVINPSWLIRTDGLFSMKASRIRNSANWQQVGFDMLSYGQYRWDDFYFNFGLIADLPINSNIQYLQGGSTELNRINPENFPNPNAQVNLLSGIEFKLMNNWKVSANFSIPTKAGNSSNIQFGISYQINKTEPTSESPRRIRKRTTKRQIRELRNGALLVRLSTSSMKIAALKAKGFPQWAEEVEKEQRVENLSLIRAFKSYYHFSEVKFFMSDQSNQVREGNFNGIFVNDDLEVDSTIELHNKSHVYSAEFAIIEPDTSRFFSHYEWVPTGNFASVPVPRFYGGGGNTFTALVIKDQNFDQLYRPFPYYSRALFKAMEDHPGHKIFYFPVMLFSPMTYSECVENLNDKLFRFYEKVND